MAGLKFFLLVTVVVVATCDEKKKEEEDYEIPPDWCPQPQRVGFYGSGKLTYLEDIT